MLKKKRGYNVGAVSFSQQELMIDNKYVCVSSHKLPLSVHLFHVAAFVARGKRIPHRMFYSTHLFFSMGFFMGSEVPCIYRFIVASFAWTSYFNVGMSPHVYVVFASPDELLPTFVTLVFDGLGVH